METNRHKFFKIYQNYRLIDEILLFKTLPTISSPKKLTNTLGGSSPLQSVRVFYSSFMEFAIFTLKCETLFNIIALPPSLNKGDIHREYLLLEEVLPA